MLSLQERARQEKADRLALEQVGTLAARMHRQLFLQLHHVMDEARLSCCRIGRRCASLQGDRATVYGVRARGIHMASARRGLTRQGSLLR